MAHRRRRQLGSALATKDAFGRWERKLSEAERALREGDCSAALLKFEGAAKARGEYDVLEGDQINSVPVTTYGGAYKRHIDFPAMFRRACICKR